MPNDESAAAFRVDTNIFRELGEYLVGRNSTALVELIKNSYDADATYVEVHGTNLETANGIIVVADDGHGMTPEEFVQGFLTIAGRTKRASEERVSPKFQRRFTGAKGVGRLAAHKLARRLEVRSVPVLDEATLGVEANVDWDMIEEYSTLDELTGTPTVGTFELSEAAQPGTTITLSRLREIWTERTRSDFLRELQTFLPPPPLEGEITPELLQSELLFGRPQIRDAGASDPGFSVELSGDLDVGDELWPDLLNLTWWVIEIDSSPDGVRYAIAPTSRAMEKYPEATIEQFAVDHPDSEIGPFFQARIFVREGPAPRAHRSAIRAMSGVRVYMEGFRVLPYGEPRDDWLGLSADYAGRSRTLDLQRFTPSDEPEKDEALLVLPQTSYIGGVFLTERRSGGLKMIVNREGFVPGASTAYLADLVRAGIDLSTRIRARYSVQRRESRRTQREKAAAVRGQGEGDESGGGPESESPRTLDELTGSVSALRDAISRASDAAKRGNLDDVAEALNQATPAIEAVSDVSDDVVSEEALTRVLASLGTQMSAFVHDLGGLVTASRDAHTLLADLRDDPEMPRTLKSDLAALDRALLELQHALERQAAYLTDVIASEARRRRSRQLLRDRFESARRLVVSSAQRQGIQIENKIPSDLRTPKPMFPAEMTTVFANLLTNAIKAAGESGTVTASAETGERGQAMVHIDNTGVSVDPANADKYFEPFESTTAKVDTVLGQGMGLGLPITRSILDEYAAKIAFSSPPSGFATRLTITFPPR